MSRTRMKVIAVLAVLAAIDIATATHAILTRHVPHAAVTSATTPGTGSPSVISVGEALGCATSALLLVAIACVIIDARWAARRRNTDRRQSNTAIKVIDV